jgi:hypothetical protein
MSITQTISQTQYFHKKVNKVKATLDENNNIVEHIDENNNISSEPIPKPESHESFEETPFYTVWLTSLGFYLLMAVGYLSQLLLKPNVTMEKYRDVSSKNYKITGTNYDQTFY